MTIKNKAEMTSQLEYTPVYIMRDGTVYLAMHNEFFSHHDIGDGECACAEARRGTMFTLDGVRMVFCNVCHEAVRAV